LRGLAGLRCSSRFVKERPGFESCPLKSTLGGNQLALLIVRELRMLAKRSSHHNSAFAQPPSHCRPIRADTLADLSI
jgi:hypothetical protein